ncbi:potassium channel family protein [Dermatobacter hominis]|uniref:potassium channel family protein n=1 Tax=Dermatobacter hominis TaxID=2884263 RepID=UPI001D10D89A|nr:potassium channel family protein [Dermatobacter hominis]UDY34490.1 hypothetical protein LH044_14230 [Dermatobacter hominis]
MSGDDAAASAATTTTTPTPRDDQPHIDRFGALLVLTTVTIVLMTLIDLPKQIDSAEAVLSSFTENALIGATFILALRASGISRRWRRVGTGLVVLALVATTLVYVVALTIETDRPLNARIPSIVFVALALVMPIAVARRLLQHRRVTLNTVLGAVSAYLLIALGFALLYLSVAALDGNDFFGQPEPSSSFMYYSLTTVTTIGLGDLTPATKLGHLLTGAEGVVGQVYLVTFVAMIVALYVTHRSEDAGDPSDGTGADDAAAGSRPA